MHAQQNASERLQPLEPMALRHACIKRQQDSPILSLIAFVVQGLSDLGMPQEEAGPGCPLNVRALTKLLISVYYNASDSRYHQCQEPFLPSSLSFQAAHNSAGLKISSQLHSNSRKQSGCPCIISALVNEIKLLQSMFQKCSKSSLLRHDL